MNSSRDTGVELDIESSFFEMVAYDTDDPDFTWHETAGLSGVANYQAQLSSLTNECHGTGQNVKECAEHAALNFGVAKAESNRVAEEAGRLSPNVSWKNKLGASSSDSEDIYKEIIRKRRKRILENCMQKDFKFDDLTYDTPNKGNTGNTITCTTPLSNDLDLNIQKQMFISTSSKQQTFNQNDANVCRKPGEPAIKQVSTCTPGKELGHEYFESPQETFTKSPKWNPYPPNTPPLSNDMDLNFQTQVFTSTSSKQQTFNQSDANVCRKPGEPAIKQVSKCTPEKEFDHKYFGSPQEKYTKSPKWNTYSPNSKELMPCYRNYQLLGDSQLLRFSEKLLKYKPFLIPTETASSRRLGYCVSGQKIKDLARRILNNESKLGDKLIILIGTNDMVYGTELKAMCDTFDSMLRKLKTIAQRIVILTVPPAPKMVNDDRNHIQKLQQFNQFLKETGDDSQVFVVDLASLFITYSNTVSEQYFERFLHKTRRSARVDLIHLNRSGFKLLKAILDIEYFDKFV